MEKFNPNPSTPPSKATPQNDQDETRNATTPPPPRTPSPRLPATSSPSPIGFSPSRFDLEYLEQPESSPSPPPLILGASFNAQQQADFQAVASSSRETENPPWNWGFRFDALIEAAQMLEPNHFADFESTDVEMGNVNVTSEEAVSQEPSTPGSGKTLVEYALNSDEDSDPEDPISIAGSQTSNTSSSQFKRERLCEVCEKTGEFVCRGCYNAFYCGPEHQNQDWENHSMFCAYQGLSRNPSLLYGGPLSLRLDITGEVSFPSPPSLYGLKLTADLPSNTKVLEEKPFLICPWPRIRGIPRNDSTCKSGVIMIRTLSCFGCGKALLPTFKQCELCRLPLCSSGCLYIENHRSAECSIIQNQVSLSGAKDKTSGPSINLKDICLVEKSKECLYMDVMIIRLIFKFDELRKSMSLDEFTNEWFKLNTLWTSAEFNAQSVSEHLKNLMINMDVNFRFSFNLLHGRKELLWRLLTILELNSFAVDLPFRRFKVLCLSTTVIGHNCEPNCQLVLREPGVEKMDPYQIEENPNNLTVVIKSRRPMQRGECLTISYVPVILGTFERREMLSKYGINCQCLRCMDPSEMSSFATNIKCVSCNANMVVPTVACLMEVPAPGSKETCVQVQTTTGLYWECLGTNPVKRSAFRRPVGGSGCMQVPHDTALAKLKSMETTLMKHTFETISGLKDLLFSFKNEQGFYYQSVLMKVAEDVLRGTYYPLPDILADDLTEYSDSVLLSIVIAKHMYANFMKTFHPEFDFEGFPIANLELVENELIGREDGKLLYDGAIRTLQGQLSRVPSLSIRPYVLLNK